MSGLSVSTRFKARGPWLLDCDQLQRLESAVEAFGQERTVRGAAADSSRTVISHHEAPSHSLVILMSHGRELEVESFKQAFVHSGSQHEMAMGFDYKFRL